MVPSHSYFALLGEIYATPATALVVSNNKIITVYIGIVDRLKFKVTEYLVMSVPCHKMFHSEINLLYCRFYASLRNQTAPVQMERGFHVPRMWHY